MFHVVSDVAPYFNRPTLDGPIVIDRTWIEFYCTVPTTETTDQAAFDVTFLFNGEPAPTVPSEVVNATAPRATLHERYLTNKLLGRGVFICVINLY